MYSSIPFFSFPSLCLCLSVCLALSLCQNVRHDGNNTTLPTGMTTTPCATHSPTTVTAKGTCRTAAMMEVEGAEVGGVDPGDPGGAEGDGWGQTKTPVSEDIPRLTA